MSRIGRCILPYGGSGSLPDPATYCPANNYYDPDDPDSGVIWNPINPADGWFLIAEFDNNSPYTTTFDPAIVGSGEYAWDLGDGTYLIGDKSVSHTYLTTATRTVKLYGKGTCEITSLNFGADNIVGELDLSHDAFKTLAIWDLYTNALMTSVVFPSTITATITRIYIYSTGVTGTLDLSMFTDFTATGDIFIHSNSAMTGVTFASSITGTMANIRAYSTGIIGTLDLSMFTTFTASAVVYLYSNSAMTNVTFASSITGTISQLYIYSTGLTGTLDISKFTAYTSSASLLLNSNTSMTNITLPSSAISGIIRTLRLYGNTSLGYLDLTKLNSTGIASLGWQMYSIGWSAAIVNQVLFDINSISASGFTGRIIEIGGTNADPDTTSGGVDGVAARNDLISKTFTVTIT